MAGNAVLSTRGLLSDPNPSCLTAKVPQVKLVYREANPLPLYCTWPRTTEGCFGRWVWSAWTPWLLLRAAASQKHLSWASSLWDAREHQGFPCDMGHLSFPETWPKIRARWLHCLCEEHTCSQGILKYSVCVETGSIGSALWSIHMVVFFFNAWGSFLFHRWLLGAPKLMGVPDQGVLQLSFHSPFLSCSHGWKGRICPFLSVLILSSICHLCNISPCLLPSLQMTCPVPRYLSTSC